MGGSTVVSPSPHFHTASRLPSRSTVLQTCYRCGILYFYKWFLNCGYPIVEYYILVNPKKVIIKFSQKYWHGLQLTT